MKNLPKSISNYLGAHFVVGILFLIVRKACFIFKL